MKLSITDLHKLLGSNPDLALVTDGDAYTTVQPKPAQTKFTEHDLQSLIIAEVNLRANQDARWGMIAAIPNGGHRDIRVAVKLKAEGVRPGFPDLLWLLPACGYYGMAMELKCGRNKLSPEQAHWLQWLSDRNYFTCVVYDDPAEAMGIFKRYLDGAR